MVAKSYQNLPIIGEPYEKNKRKYIIVECKNGHRKEVRFYTEAEYAKMYPTEANKDVDAVLGKKIRTTKEVLGFANGYITIFKGDTYALLDWLQEEPKCRYHKIFGWYVISEDELPTLPAGIEPIRLYWENVAIVEEDCLKSEDLIKQHINSLIYEPSKSIYQGNIGDRLEKTLIVIKAIPIESYYGNSTMHIFSDPEENVYVWTTAAKTLEVGKTYVIRGTVREHKSFKNIPQTILTRCMICQDKIV